MTESVRRKRKERDWFSILSPFAVLIIIFGILELVTRGFGISRYVLPPPSVIVYDTVRNFGDILPHFLFTIKIITLGFTIAIPLGMLLAAILSQFDILIKAISPVIIFLVITPMIVLIPLIMLWLGVDPNLRVVVVCVQATPIITLNTLNGFTQVETEKLELAKSVGATRIQRFIRIVFMNAMPQVFMGIKLGCVFSTIAAVSSDFVAYTIGLGFRILQYAKYNLTGCMYGCIILISLIGITLFNIVQAIEKRVVLWKK